MCTTGLKGLKMLQTFNQTARCSKPDAQKAMCTSSMNEGWRRFDSTAAPAWGARCELTAAGRLLLNKLLRWLEVQSKDASLCKANFARCAHFERGSLLRLLHVAGPACPAFLNRVHTCDLAAELAAVPTELARAVLLDLDAVHFHRVTFELLEPRFKIVGLTAC